MKRIFSQLFILVALIFPALSFAQSEPATDSAAAPAPTIVGPQTYTIDPSHTYVLWHINHLGFSNQAGKWPAEGTLVFDDAKPQNSKVDITINVADVVTGIDKLNEHLRGADFFDVAKFPKATFVSNTVTKTGQNTAQVQGTLTLHGVSKPITLDVTLNKVGVSPITQKKTIGFSATTNLKRSDYGITAYLPGLGDEVKINIEGEAFLAG